MTEHARDHRQPANEPGARVRLTRRSFGAGAGAAVAAGCLYLLGRNVATGVVDSAPAPAPEVPLETLDSIAFGARVGDQFTVRLESGAAVKLELVQLIDVVSGGSQTAARAMRMESFSLVFAGPADQQLGQNTFRFENERIGAFPLFIVPGSAEGGARTYVATFNRLV